MGIVQVHGCNLYGLRVRIGRCRLAQTFTQQAAQPWNIVELPGSLQFQGMTWVSHPMFASTQ